MELPINSCSASSASTSGLNLKQFAARDQQFRKALKKPLWFLRLPCRSTDDVHFDCIPLLLLARRSVISGISRFVALYSSSIPFRGFDFGFSYYYVTMLAPVRPAIVCLLLIAGLVLLKSRVPHSSNRSHRDREPRTVTVPLRPQSRHVAKLPYWPFGTPIVYDDGGKDGDVAGGNEGETILRDSGHALHDGGVQTIFYQTPISTPNDRTIVVGKLKEQNTDWVSKELNE